MRRIPVILLFVTTLTAAGCAGGRGMLLPPKQVSSTLLFDTYPSLVRASDLASRSNWPAARSLAPHRTSVSYEEHFVDVQGRGFGSRHRDYTYRRFETRRTGHGRR